MSPLSHLKMSPTCPHSSPTSFIFISLFKEKALNNNNKELEVDRKSVGKPGQNQERSSVFAVFKKVKFTSSAGLEAALSPNHSHRISDIFFSAFLYIRLTNLISLNVSFSDQVSHIDLCATFQKKKNCCNTLGASAICSWPHFFGVLSLMTLA